MDGEKRAIVVGGGLAGISATLEFANKGIPVVLIDREERLGGNSAKATSGINGFNTEAQKKLGIKDSYDQFYADSVTAGDDENDPDLIDALIRGSTDAIDWLIKMGVPLHDITLCGGHSIPRTHWIHAPKDAKPIPIGLTIINTLKKKIEEEQAAGKKITVLTKTKAISLLEEKGKVVGVTVVRENEDGAGYSEDMRAKAVVLTTGGFSNDHAPDSLLTEFAPDKQKFPTTNGDFADGSGIKMARKLNASLYSMHRVQVHPTAFVDPADPKKMTKFLAAEALRGSGALLLNQNGLRFSNELDRRDYLVERIMETCPWDNEADAQVAYMLVNEATIEKFGWAPFNFYYKVKKFFKRYENVDEMTKDAGFNLDDIRNTMEYYNTFVKLPSAEQKKQKDMFDKEIFPTAFMEDEPLYLAKVTPAIHYTMGGLEIRANAEVLIQKTPLVIKGLYAAGEVTGGTHGSNRLGGNSLLECVVFGKLAGQYATDYIIDKDPFKGHDEL